MEMKRLIEVANSALSDDLCEGCGKYGDFTGGCEECFKEANVQIRGMLMDLMRKEGETE
jgi:hypothetical protein